MINQKYEAQAAPSRAKSLIYQEDTGRPVTPPYKGTKGPPGGPGPQLVPFATAEGASDAFPADFHPIEKKTTVTGKAAADAFDPQVYLNNRADNVRNMAESKMRNRGGGESPYATQEGDGRAAAFASKSFHKQEGQKALPEKIGTNVDFDPEVYRKSRADHMQQQEESRVRNRGAGAGAPGGGSCPFATSDNAEYKQQWQRTDYHAKQGPKSYADKIGGDKSFDPTVYSNALATNRQNQADSSQRNFVGSGNILEFKPTGH